MASKWTLVVCALLVAQALATREVLQSKAKSSTSLQVSGKAGTEIAASAKASAFVKGHGTVEAHAQATGEAMVEVANEVVRIVAESVKKAENGGNATSLAAVSADAYGLALAQAYVDVIVDITSSAKKGKACVSAFSDAKSTATAFARIVVDVLADASNKIAFASAAGAVEAISAATAKAFADAEADACGEGVFNAQIEASAFGEAVAEPCVVVFAAAYAAVAADFAVAEIVLKADSDVLEASYSDGSTFADIHGKIEASGSTNSSASTTPREICPSKFNICCKGKRSACRCGIGCKANSVKFHDPKGIGYELAEKNARSTIQLAVGDRCICSP